MDGGDGSSFIFFSFFPSFHSGMNYKFVIEGEERECFPPSFSSLSKEEIGLFGPFIIHSSWFFCYSSLGSFKF